MIRTTVLTSIMDDYDTLKPVLAQDGADVTWVCLTDSAQLAAEAEERVIRPGSYFDHIGMVHPTGWEIVYYDRPTDEHPNRAAKRPKVAPQVFTPAPCSIWLDASFRVVSPRFVADTVAIMEASRNGIAQFRHPWRDCLHQEARVSAELAKYADQNGTIARQAMEYSRDGMPSDWGLWATGVIVRRHDAAVLNWGHAWGREIERHSYQDQISHPYTLWRAGLRPVDLPGTHLGNQWLAYEGSGRH